LLIRHGRPDLDSHDFRTTARGRQWDPPLNEVGHQQALALAARLLMMDRPAGVFVSPFRRCGQTAEPFLEATHGGAEIERRIGSRAA